MGAKAALLEGRVSSRLLALYCTLCSAWPSPPRTTSPLPFNCSVDEADSTQSLTKRWSVSKRAWCCQHGGKGCPDPLTPAPVSLPFDCAADYVSCNLCLEKKWSLEKRAWCCSHGGKGCPITTAPKAPTTSLSFDCKTALDNWQAAWSPEKKTWCCQHESKGCPTLSSTPTTTMMLFHCSEAFDNWQVAWSAAKKAWCCKQENQACPGQPFRPPTTNRVSSTSPCPPMDCNAAFNNWQASWSPVKKRYCCEKAGRGCPPGQQPTKRPAFPQAHPKPFPAIAAPQPQPVAAVAATAAPQLQPMPVRRAVVPQPQPQAAPAGIRPAVLQQVSSMLPQDCNVGFANWQVAWSLSKQRWCCSYEGKGCLPGMVPFEAFLSVKNEDIEERSPPIAASKRQAAVWTSSSMLPIVGVFGSIIIGFVFLASFRVRFIIGLSSSLYRGLQEAGSLEDEGDSGGITVGE